MSQNFLLAAQQAGGIELVGFVGPNLARAEDRRAAFAPGAAALAGSSRTGVISAAACWSAERHQLRRRHLALARPRL